VNVHSFGRMPKGRAGRLRELLAIPPADGAWEELSAIADANPYGELGDAPVLYIQSSRGFARSSWVEEDLDEALRDRTVVLLGGESESGKWRTAWEAVGRVLPDARLLVPRLGVPVLAELLNLTPPLRVGAGPVVVWLDGLERYLDSGTGIGVEMMERLQSLAPRVVILASVRGDVRANLLSSQGGLGPVARQVLDVAATIVVPAPDRLPGQGRAGTERLNAYADTGLDGLRAADIPILERRYRDGRAGRATRIGWAIVHAAADWRRTGMLRPVTERELRELTAFYQDQNQSERVSALEDAQWAAGLGWALTVPLGATASLLREISPDEAQEQGEPATRSFQPVEFLTGDRVEPGTAPRDQSDIPDAVWKFTLRRCDPFELIAVSIAANKDAGVAVAEAALRRAMRSLDASSSCLAGLLLAGRLEERGEVTGAINAYRQCVADGEHLAPESPRRSSGAARHQVGGQGMEMPAGPAMVSAACLNLASLLRKENRTQEAVEAWRKGMAREDPGGAPLCAMSLGGFLNQHGDPAGARSAYERALDLYTRHGDPDDMHGMAAVELGLFLARTGEYSAARPVLEIALRSGHRVAAPKAAAMLGMILLVSDQDPVGARRAFVVAADADDQEVAARARFELAKLDAETEPEKAVSHYRALTSCDLREIAEESWLRLGILLYDVLRDLPGAEEALQKAMGARDEVTRGKAAYCMGRLLLDREEWDGARRAFAIAVQTDVAKAAGLSWVYLGDTQVRLGQISEGRQSYLRASRSSDARARQLGADRLRELDLGDGADE
jgi:tetratricopeptide (TPR) repeat protein